MTGTQSTLRSPSPVSQTGRESLPGCAKNSMPKASEMIGIGQNSSRSVESLARRAFARSTDIYVAGIWTRAATNLVLSHPLSATGFSHMPTDRSACFPQLAALIANIPGAANVAPEWQAPQMCRALEATSRPQYTRGECRTRLKARHAARSSHCLHMGLRTSLLNCRCLHRDKWSVRLGRLHRQYVALRPTTPRFCSGTPKVTYLYPHARRHVNGFRPTLADVGSSPNGILTLENKVIPGPGWTPEISLRQRWKV